jgi:type II secretory pathway pseudopilin PulG
MARGTSFKNAGALPARRRSTQGAVLLEVVLALVLFVGAASIITAGLRASLDGTERLRLNTHAANLAVSLLSEIKMGTRAVETGEPQPFEAPFEAWTWQLLAEEGARGSAPIRQVEVVVRHLESGLTFRLAEAIRLPAVLPPDESDGTFPSFGGGQPTPLFASREGQ